MSVTNPPPIRVPQKFATDRETFGYFQELHTFLRLLWQRTGGGTDLIEENYHDPVTVADSAEIKFTLAGQQITASLIAGSIDETRLDTSVNVSLVSAATAEINAASMATLIQRLAALSSEVAMLRQEVSSLYSNAASIGALTQRINEVELLCL